MKSIQVQILQSRAMTILRRLERMKLIRLTESMGKEHRFHNSAMLELEGSMTRQSKETIQAQLNALRREWSE